MNGDKASSTAYTVVHGILHTAKNPKLKYLVRDDTIEACKKILQASDTGRMRLKELDSPIKSKMLPFLEWLLLPGATLNYVLRKKYIEEKVLEAIDSGVMQIVNIGAGFDTLAYRLSNRLVGINFIEIDHPATSREKTKALSKEQDAMSNLHFLAVDLSKEDMESSLNVFSGFKNDQKTLYICEGVLMYLQEKHVIGLFDTLRNLTGTGSVFIFSCMEPNDSEKNNARPLLHCYLKLKNELYNWYIQDSELPDFVKKRGYILKEIADSEAYRRSYLNNNYSCKLHQGEYVAVTEII